MPRLKRTENRFPKYILLWNSGIPKKGFYIPLLRPFICWENKNKTDLKVYIYICIYRVTRKKRVDSDFYKAVTRKKGSIKTTLLFPGDLSTLFFRATLYIYIYTYMHIHVYIYTYVHIQIHCTYKYTYRRPPPLFVRFRRVE